MNNGEEQKKRILIVDDHPVSREGLRALIRQTEDIIDCGEAEDAERAISMTTSLRPDLVLVDISLPGRSGIELLKDLKAMEPHLPLLVLSMYERHRYEGRALRAGAWGYVVKNQDSDALLNAMRTVLRGQRLQKAPAARRNRAPSPYHLLTKREGDIFRLLGQGIRTVQIAERLRRSPKTIETHRMNIKKKLGFGTAAELIAYASRWNSSEADA